MAKILLLLLLLGGCSPTRQAKLPGTPRVIAFYNVENLFDTIDDPNTRDNNRTPQGRDQWSAGRYHEKLRALSRVIPGVGEGVSAEPPVIVGLCEVENWNVLNDLVQELKEKGVKYDVIHVDSPDERGIDVAFLYRNAYFQPVEFQAHRLPLKRSDGTPDHSRDILVVSGWLGTTKIHFLINHWPSRSGGRLRSEPNRLAAAYLHRRITDSLYRLEGDPNLVSMGDYNDNPDDKSLWIASRTGDQGSLLNPMQQLYRKGQGSLAYRDRWHLFDQFLISRSLTGRAGIKVIGAGIYKPRFLQARGGPYSGYPLRTYGGGRYIGGYSDHFPVYLIYTIQLNH